MNLKHTAVWLVVATLSVAASAAEVKTVNVTVEVPINGDKTESDAKRAARREAVEQGAGVLVESNSIMRNYALIADEIATSAKGVILDEVWGPLADGKTANTKSIKLTAKVSPEAVSDAICTVMKANHDPKVSLVFVEKFGDEDKWSTERGMVEAIFTNAFVESCFTIVESGVKVTEISANGDLPRAVMEEIVKNVDAQYVVLGSGKFLKMKVDEKDPGLLGKMNSYSMSASLKMINTSTGEIEAVSTKQLQVMGISPEKALEANDSKVKKNLTGFIMDELLKKVSARWSDDLVNTSKVNVQVEGVVNYAASKAFKDLVAKTLKGTINERRVTNGRGSYDVELEGGAEKLAELIEGKKAGKFTIEVVEVNGRKVTLKLNP